MTTDFFGKSASSGFDVSKLFVIVNNAVISAKTKLSEINANKSSISIGDMFEMQMLMNHLSQLTEMSTGLVSASHQSVMSMSRNVKG